MIVITGPTGNVGAELVRLLSEQDELCYRIAAHCPARFPDLPAVRLDYDDPATFDTVLDGVTTLFLLFPLPHPRTVRTRMIPFVDAAVRAGCRHIVYVSVPGADRVKVVPHHAVERHIAATGVDHTFLRCGFFMQNLCRKVSTHGVDLMDHGELFIPGGRGRTTFLDSRDVAAVVLDILRAPAPHRNRAYTLTGPESLTLHQAAHMLSQALERPIRYTSPSLPRFWIRLARRGVTWDTLLFMSIVYTLTRTGRNEPMTGELPALLGRPATRFEQWAADYRPRFERREWT